MTSEQPFDAFRKLVADPKPADEAARLAALRRMAGFSVQGAALGRLSRVAGWLAAWSGRAPQVTRPLVALFVGTHGFAADRAERERLQAMVEHTAAGGAAINQLCAARDLGLKVFDLALDVPTGDIAREAALDEKGCAATMAFGMEAMAGGVDLLCLGSIGTDGEVAAAAIMAALHGGPVAAWCETSRAINDPEAAARQLAVVQAALAAHDGHLGEPLEALRRLGGREIAAIAGAILAARSEKVPVILDGYASLAAAAVLHAMEPSAVEHCLVGHVTVAPAHRRAAEALGLEPLLDLGLGEGEGLGSALAAGIVRDAALVCSGMREIG